MRCKYAKNTSDALLWLFSVFSNRFPLFVFTFRFRRSTLDSRDSARRIRRKYQTRRNRCARGTKSEGPGSRAKAELTFDFPIVGKRFFPTMKRNAGLLAKFSFRCDFSQRFRDSRPHSLARDSDLYGTHGYTRTVKKF